jgi:hypothetical protein
VKLLCFLIAMFSRTQRINTWRALKQLCTPLTDAQKFQVKKAKREAKRAFQPRRIALGNGRFRVGEPGEVGGERYSIINATAHDLSGFGLHICGYFMHLKGLVVLCLFVTCTNLPSILYFRSDGYILPEDMAFWLRGSAVCGGIEGRAQVNALNQTVDIIRNPCPFTERLGIFGMVSVGGMAFFLVAIRFMLDREMENMDEKSQTAQDYSVVVKDPDHDARDPDEWHAFFSQFGEVASITVALRNGKLLRDLARQRYVRLMVEYEAPQGTDPFEEMGDKDKAHPHWLKHEVRARASHTHLVYSPDREHLVTHAAFPWFPLLLFTK